MSAKELNIGDYVRDEKGNIDKYIGEKEEAFTYSGFGGAVSLRPQTIKYYEKNNIKAPIIKSSPNIIDLIEVGDYVNGHKVLANQTYILRVESRVNTWGIAIIEEQDIKSIVTKEMYSSVEYRVETN